MFGYIYLTTNMINNRKYIGQKTGGFNPKYYGSGIILKQALKVYGKNNFSIDVLAEAKNKNELNELEKYFIERFSACESHEFYNIHEGGNGGNTKAGYTEEEMKMFGKKISETKQKNPKPPMTEKEKEHLRKINTGEGNAMFGKPSAMRGRKHTLESRKKMSESQKGLGLGYIRTSEMNKKTSEGLKKFYSNKENLIKCSRKNEENGMSQPVEVIFPWGESVKFTLIKTMVESVHKDYGISCDKLRKLACSQEPWINIKNTKQRERFTGLVIKHIKEEVVKWETLKKLLIILVIQQF